jgi:uncharacterized membrane protein (TIGR02234 family)
VAERSFGPTVLLGVGAGVLAAVSGSRDWVSVEPVDPDAIGTALVLDGFPGLGQMPLAGALGLVVLACWGVVLVSRGLPRRVVAWLGLVAALGLVATWLTGLVTLADSVVETLEAGGAAGAWDTAWTAWFWVAGLSALGCVAAAAVAAVRVPRWPAMGSRYDAPTGRGAEAAATRRRDGAQGEVADGAGGAGTGADPDPAALWKALDEGRDPTQDPTQDRAP